MQQEYHKYRYDGPICLFDKCVADHWKGETSAPSKKKARSNLTYQAKQQLNLVAGSKIQLPGKIEIVN